MSTVRTSATVVAAALWATLLAGCDGSSSVPVCQQSPDPHLAVAFCAPARIAAGQPLRLQIREQCGTCTRRATRCEVAVEGLNLKLRLLGETCTLPAGAACPELCATNLFDCTVPALAANTYRVFAEAGAAMVVMMTADPAVSATACTLP